MYNLVSRFLLYSNISDDSILKTLASTFEAHNRKMSSRQFLSEEEIEQNKTETIQKIYTQIKKILDLGTTYGFNTNLWHNYLTYLMISTENSFTLTCERMGAQPGGSVNIFARKDFAIFKQLFEYDFSKIEKDLDIDVFSTITDYKAIAKKENIYNKEVSRIVQDLSLKIAAAEDEDEIFDIVTEHYKNCGVGLFGINRAFRIKNEGNGIEFIPVVNSDHVRLDDLIGLEYQKEQLVYNTLAFVNGRKANNVLLYGDAGTGKSTSVRAVLNEYHDKGLRMIEIYKHQFKDLAAVIAKIKDRNYRFIIFIDDLSFEEYEVEYKFLKVVIEGGVESRPENILIYATSNRRHLIKEQWKDRDDMEHSSNGELHRSDTLEEKLSLAGRFGVLINFSAPRREEFYEIVKVLAERHGIKMDEETLIAEANKWEISHGGVSGRTAQQFINYLEGLE